VPIRVTLEAGSAADDLQPVLTSTDPVVVEATLRALARRLDGRLRRLERVRAKEPPP
jgi:hypothetical protein